MNGRLAWLLVGVSLPMLSLHSSAQNVAAPPVALTELPGWKECGAQAIPTPNGYRIVQPAREGTFAWVELRVPIDVDRYPEMLVEVEGASPLAKWCLKVDPTAEGDPPEVWFIPETDQNGTLVFPTGEYLDRYGRIDAIVRFFIVGKYRSEVLLKRLELRGEGAANITEGVRIDETARQQVVDGAGGQGDYPLWTVGASTDGVSAEGILSLLTQLRDDGVSLARVGAYSDVTQAATSDPGNAVLAGFIRHLQALREHHIGALFVTWYPPTETLGKPAKTDEWLRSFVDRCAQFLAYCHEHGAPIAFFELQNEPHANRQWWDPAFLGRCGRALAEELERRGLPVEVIGPDGWDLEWVIPWAKAMGDKGHIIALKAGADQRGTREMTAHQVADTIARCQRAVPGERRYWLTEYGCWAWGNPDQDRRGEGGPCDGYRYGLAMAELTHYYLRAGISCPSIWELYDVRRIDEVAGRNPPQDPKRWGMLKYKTENWEKRSHFYTLGHYFRALEPGATVYDCASSGGLLPTAVKSDEGWRVLVCNRFRYPKGAVAKLPSGDWGQAAEWAVTGPDSPYQTFTVPLREGQAAVGLPGYGVGSLILRPAGAAASQEKGATVVGPGG